MTYEQSEDGRARMNGSFENLVPNGVYTLWCSRMRLPPNAAISDLPCGELDGSTSTIIADAQGRVSFDLDTWVMPETTVDEVNVIALAWHSDGRTYGADPGLFGLQTHVHIFGMFAPAMPTAE